MKGLIIFIALIISTSSFAEKVKLKDIYYHCLGTSSSSSTRVVLCGYIDDKNIDLYNSCYAISTETASTCSQIKNDDLRNNCDGITRNSSYYCSLIKDSNLGHHCYANTMEVYSCGHIENDSDLLANCMAIKSQNDNYCSTMDTVQK